MTAKQKKEEKCITTRICHRFSCLRSVESLFCILKFSCPLMDFDKSGKAFHKAQLRGINVVPRKGGIHIYIYAKDLGPPEISAIQYSRPETAGAAKDVGRIHLPTPFTSRTMHLIILCNELYILHLHELSPSHRSVPPKHRTFEPTTRLNCIDTCTRVMTRRRAKDGLEADPPL